MSSFHLSPTQRVRREFTIRRDQLGHWVASETQGLIEGVFFTCKDARRFALREADDDPSRVHVDPDADVFHH